MTRRRGALSTNSRTLETAASLLRIVPAEGVSPDALAGELMERIEETEAFPVVRGTCAWLEGPAIILSIAWTLTGGARRSAVAAAINETVAGRGEIERLDLRERDFPTDPVRLVLGITIHKELAEPALAADDAPAFASWLASWLPGDSLDLWLGASRVTTANPERALRALFTKAAWIVADKAINLGAASRAGVSLDLWGEMSLFARGPREWSADWDETAAALADAATRFPAGVFEARMLAVDFPELPGPDSRRDYRRAQRPEHRRADAALWTLDSGGSRWHGELVEWWREDPR